MSEASTGPRYLMRWDHSRDQRLGRDVWVTTHRLTELPIFSDEGLADIVDRCPREALQVSTMGDDPAYPSQARIGQLEHHCGHELIEMVRRGRLCLRIKKMVRHHEGLRRIVERLCREMTECQPGLRTLNHDGDLEISSPAALTYYRCDAQPSVFWQIRGCRVISVYPTGEPFVDPGSLEEAIACGSRKPLYFEPAFDDASHKYSQTAGDALSLPQHTPYRIINDQCLSVTLTTNCQTRESLRRNQIHRANHMLNRWLPSTVRSIETVGLPAALKRFLLRVAARRPVENLDPPPTFRVDPDAPGCVAPLEAAAPKSDTTNPNFPGFGFEAPNSATAASET